MDGTAIALELDGHGPKAMNHLDLFRSVAVAMLLLLCVYRPADCAAQVPADSLDVLSWNIYMRPSAIFWNGQMKRAEHIGMLLKDSDHDVLLFQEAFGRKSRKVLRKALDGSFPYEVLPAGKGRMLNSGLWVLSRLPIHDVQVISFRNCMGLDCTASKGAVLVEVEQPWGNTQVLNTHLQANYGAGEQAVRQEQYVEILDLLEANAKPGVPQVVAGDLNTDQQDLEDYETMLATLNAKNGALKRSPRAEKVELPISTWGGPLNTLIKKRSRGDKKLLDYTLVRESDGPDFFENITVQRVLHFFTSPWSRKHDHLSDHHPISIRFVGR